MSELISVIVPVYKVEKYLDACVESIVKQTYKDIEIILVDDGSPDNCPAMCDAWAKKDRRIKVIHQANSGGAAARNNGIEASTGELIAFVDSDDKLHPAMYETMLSIMREQDCDIVECTYTMTDDSFSKAVSKNIIGVFDKRGTMDQQINGKYCQQLIWNKLYKRETVADVRFVPGKMIDDEFFTYRVLGNSEKTVVIDSEFYFYRQQPDSVMHRSYSLKRLAAVEAKIERLNYVKEYFPEFTTAANLGAAGSCIYNGQMALKYLTSEDRKTAFDFLSETYKSCKITYGMLNGKNLTHKLWYLIANISLPLCCKIRNTLNIGF